MRWLFGFVLLLLALGTPRMVGCGEASECQSERDCDDQNECTHEYCDGGTCRRTIYDEGRVLCDDGDDNECLYGACYDGACSSDIGDYQSPYWVDALTPCESGGVSGVCVRGECVEPKCQTDGDCDDGDPCTEDTCQNLSTFECSYGPVRDCSYSCDLKGASGRCVSGVCVEDLCEGVVCDDGDPCTSDFCSCPSWECNFSFCPHGNQCTDAFCNPRVGCSYPPANEGMYCGCGAWMPEECPPFTFSCGYTCVAPKYCRNGQCG